MDTNDIRIGTMLNTSYFYRYKNVSSVVKIGTGVIKIGTYLSGPCCAKAKNRHFSRAFLQGGGSCLVLSCLVLNYLVLSCPVLSNPNPNPNPQPSTLNPLSQVHSGSFHYG